MGNYKLPMELIADKKTRFRTFRNREKGLQKKLSELCTLCDIKAFMIVYGPDGDGPCSSQPRFWPESRSQVECVIKEYMEKRKEEPGKRSSDLSDALEIGRKRADPNSSKLQENFGKKKRPPSLLGGLDKFSYEELMEIIGKLDNKLEEVDNLIAVKKGETNSMSEVSVHCSPLPVSSAIQPFDNRVPMQWVDSDQGTGAETVDDDLNSIINSMLSMDDDDFDFMMKSMGETDNHEHESYDLNSVF